MKNLTRQALDNVNSQESSGGFGICQLQPHTKILIETRHSFYDIEYLKDREAIIFGGRMWGDGMRFSEKTRILICGSTWGGSMIKLNWIGHNMRLEFQVIETGGIVVTSPIINAIIESPDGSWQYSLDWKTDPTRPSALFQS